MPKFLSPVAAVLLFLAPPAPFADSPLFQNLGSGAFETIDNHSQPGKWLIVMIWAHDCEVCEREIGDYQAFHRKHADDDAVVLGITLDGSEWKRQAVNFVARHQLSFENLIAEPETVAAYYQIVTGTRWVGTPSFLIFGPDKALKAKQVGAVATDLVEQFIATNTAAP